MNTKTIKFLLVLLITASLFPLAHAGVTTEAFVAVRSPVPHLGVGVGIGVGLDLTRSTRLQVESEAYGAHQLDQSGFRQFGSMSSLKLKTFSPKFWYLGIGCAYHQSKSVKSEYVGGVGPDYQSSEIVRTRTQVDLGPTLDFGLELRKNGHYLAIDIVAAYVPTYIHKQTYTVNVDTSDNDENAFAQHFHNGFYNAARLRFGQDF